MVKEKATALKHVTDDESGREEMVGDERGTNEGDEKRDKEEEIKCALIHSVTAGLSR